MQVGDRERNKLALLESHHFSLGDELRKFLDANPGVMSDSLAYDLLEALAEASETPVLWERLTTISEILGAAQCVYRDGDKSRFKRIGELLEFAPREKPFRILWDYVELVTQKGGVILSDYIDPSIRHELREVPLERFKITEKIIPNCPLEPWGAIDALKGFYGFASPDSCLRWLQRKAQQLRESWSEIPPELLSKMARPNPTLNNMFGFRNFADDLEALSSLPWSGSRK